MVVELQVCPCGSWCLSSRLWLCYLPGSQDEILLLSIFLLCAGNNNSMHLTVVVYFLFVQFLEWYWTIGNAPWLTNTYFIHLSFITPSPLDGEFHEGGILSVLYTAPFPPPSPGSHQSWVRCLAVQEFLRCSRVSEETC